MRSRIGPFVCILLLAGASSAAVISQETIAPGVLFTKHGATGPNNVFVVSIDRLRSEYKLQVGWSQAKRYYTARERTSTICNRYENPPVHDVLAGVNGSFIDTVNMPRMLGVGQTDGEMLDTPSLNASYTYHTVMVGPERKPVVRTNFNHQPGTITFADGYTMPLTQYNFNMSGSLAPINSVVAFTPGFDSSTRTDFSVNPSLAAEVVLTDVSYPMRSDKEVAGIVSTVKTPTSGNAAIPAGGMVLTAWGGTKSTLVAHAKVGERVRVRVASTAEEYNNSDNAVTGIGWVIRNGSSYPAGWTNLESGAAPSSRNPRTVLAWNDATWFMVVCDGRSGASVGMTFAEMADFLIGTLGATEGVNYDGGGSSTMVVNGAVRNVPSDGSERAIGNAIMLVKHDTSTVFPFADLFAMAGRAAGWDDKFTYNAVIPFSPSAPASDGYALKVLNPLAPVETVRRGDFGDDNYSARADVYCEYRPAPSDGSASYREHYALFARDSGTGALGLSTYGGGNCYALVYDADSGRVIPGKYVNGGLTDFRAGDPMYLPSTAWRRFRIDCSGTAIRYFVNDAQIAEVQDDSFARGYYGIGYHSFVVNGEKHGTRADNFEVVELGSPPGKAANPNPPHGAKHVILAPVLGWTAGAGVVSQEVYFGTTSPGVFLGSQSGSTFAAGPLQTDTTYYWRVDGINENGKTTGDVWSFTTQYYLGDLDGDDDVDQEDFGVLQTCLSGTGIPQYDLACTRANLDGDSDVDFQDLDLFIACHSGPDMLPPPTCLQ